MQTLRNIAALLLLPASLTLAACGSYSKSPTDATPVTQPSQLTTFITNGTWVVSSLTERTEDKTSQFEGFTFTFGGAGSEAGTVVATKSGTSVSGTWTHSAAVTYYGSTSKESIALSLSSASPFDRLAKTWNVVSTTSTTLTLVNPEVLQDEHLVFSRQ